MTGHNARNTLPAVSHQLLSSWSESWHSILNISVFSLTSKLLSRQCVTDISRESYDCVSVGNACVCPINAVDNWGGRPSLNLSPVQCCTVQVYCTLYRCTRCLVATCNQGLGPIARVTNVWAVRTVSCQLRSGAAGVKTWDIALSEIRFIRDHCDHGGTDGEWLWEHCQ